MKILLLRIGLKEEKLEFFFDGEIMKENIKPLIKSVKADEVYVV